MRLAALLLAMVLAVPAGCAGLVSCPAAVLEGTLVVVADASGVGVQHEDGIVGLVDWPQGWSARAGEPVTLIDRNGTILARVGDHVRMGGGYAGEPERFQPCPRSISVLID